MSRYSQYQFYPGTPKDNLHFGNLYIDEKDGFSSSEVEFYQDQIKIMDDNVKDYLTNPATTPIERYECNTEGYFIHPKTK